MQMNNIMSLVQSLTGYAYPYMQIMIITSALASVRTNDAICVT